MPGQTVAAKALVPPFSRHCPESVRGRDDVPARTIGQRDSSLEFKHTSPQLGLGWLRMPRLPGMCLPG